MLSARSVAARDRSSAISSDVAAAASIAGDISQDLKSGYLLGATPAKLQVSELFGTFRSAFIIAFAVGIYLPLSTMTPVFVGGVINYFVEVRRSRKIEDVAEKQTDTGVLFCSGLIAGEGIMGVVIAGFAFVAGTKPGGLSFGLHGLAGEAVSFVIFCLLSAYLVMLASKKQVE